VDRFFDTSAFRILQTNPALDGFVPRQAFGNSGVGVLRGPGLFNIDFNLSRNFAVTERHVLQFRAEFYNLFNNVNYGNPNTTFAAANFGRITSAGSMRQVQLGGKVLF